ncbi:hypothetical protein [Marinilactibacillus kalidii]|uniref:hypothetical protein n=1 Tax=Marinilactibacillus kalidii TaxID=2820274 RepID=UPI001ABE3DCB|nr:hypothetical protein [Marinilactibacillus kalidii]
MGRRGGGGGGRSGGSSFGGSRGGSSRLGGSGGGRRGASGGSSGRSNGNFGGGFGGGGYNRGYGYGGGWGYGRGFGWGRRRNYGGGFGGGGCGLLGCLGPFLFFIILMNLIGGVGMFGNTSNNQMNSTNRTIQSSSRERTPLEAGAVNETAYYTDNANWIGNATTLENGMRYYYEKTGIQPYLYITEEIDGNANPSLEELEAFKSNLYDELFDDEAHMLVLFFESDTFELDDYYYVGTEIGAQARSVMDREAQDIFYDYLDRYYFDDIEEEVFFAQSFQETADRMMTVTRSPWITISMIFGGVVLVGLLFTWWLRVLKKDREAAKPDESYKSQTENDDLDF